MPQAKSSASFTSTESTEPLFLAACRGQALARPPIWIMRQAGRYLPEYREVRSRMSFLELCKTPAAAAEVTLQPIRRFGFDASIVFSDILIPVEAMGCPVAFPGDGGPVLSAPIRNADDVGRLSEPVPLEKMPFVMEAIAKIVAELPASVPLIGFAGAPFTLATYMVEGGASKSFAEIKKLIFGKPAVAHALLGKLSRVVANFLLAQVDAGARAVQLFDTWAGILAPGDYAEFAQRYVKQVVSVVRAERPQLPVIYYVNGGAAILEAMADTDATVIGVDWRISLRQARRRLGAEVPVQGNLDPTVLLGPSELVTLRAREIIAEAGPSGHIFNLGHGILPETPPAIVEALIEAVRR